MKRTDNVTTNSEYLRNGIADIVVKILNEGPLVLSCGFFIERLNTMSC
jgi:hypothetical protein